MHERYPVEKRTSLCVQQALIRFQHSKALPSHQITVN